MPDEILSTTTNNPPTEAGFSIPHIAARFFNTPLLIEPAKVEALAWAFRSKLGLSMEQPTGPAMEASGPGLFGGARDERGGYCLDRGVAVIPIRGTLVNRGAWIGSYSGLTSYEGIAKQLDLAAQDDRVAAVMLDIHSYGGEATGVDDLGQMIRAFEKPIYAMIDGAGTSAAYWIAAACDRVYIAKSSRGGSIGVVITHSSMQGMLEENGIKVTHIHAGALKVLGSPYKDLSEADRDKLQTSVDQTYRAFVEAIAEFRGLSTEEVRATEAGVFDGPELVAKGLADQVTTGRRLLAAIQNNYQDPDPDRVPGFPSGNSRANAYNGGNPMGDTNRTGGAEKTAEQQYTQAELDAKLKEQAEANQRALDARAAEAQQAGIDRVVSIITHAAAEGREPLAMKMAKNVSLSVEQVIEYLESSPKASSTAPDPLSQLMAGKSPGVSSDDGSAIETEADETEAAANFILNAGRAGTNTED
jgi:signal peptide peptidase SppA